METNKKKLSCLNVESNYSFYKSIVNSEKLCSKLKEYNYSSFCVSDFNSLSSIFDYANVAKKYNLKFTIGIKVKIYHQINDEIELTVICKNFNGYKKLIDYHNNKKRDYFESFEDFNAVFDSEDLIVIYSSNNFKFFFDKKMTSISQMLNNQELKLDIIKLTNAKKQKDVFDFEVNKFISRFSFDIENSDLKKYFLNKKYTFYFGLEIYDLLSQVFFNRYLCPLFDMNNINYVVNNKVLYVDSVEYSTLVKLMEIKAKKDINKFDNNLSNSYFLLNYSQLSSLYTDKAIDNMELIETNIDFDLLKEVKGELITYSDSSEDDYENLKEIVYASLENHNLLNNETYKKRVDFELSVIHELKFQSYFLLVKDIVDYANNNSIKIGPGRGSSASSLICYLLNITKLDPIEYNLSFQRFLNKARVQMPDIDIDVEDTKRELICSYLLNKFSKNNVCAIRTYTSYKVKNLLNDLKVVSLLTDEDYQFISNNMNLYGTNIDIKKEFDRSNPLKNRYNKDASFKKIIDVIFHLSNSTLINTSIHPAGLIISKVNLREVLPLTHTNSVNADVIEVEFSYLEKQNFLKLDLLSLSNLSFLSDIEKNIELIYKQTDFPKYENNTIDLSDKKTFTVLNSLFLENIFQLNSSKTTENILKKDNINTFLDLTNIIALNRPGPIDNIDLYISNKQNQKSIKYLNDELKNILTSTYNIIIYQEQIIEIAHKLANLSLEDADMFRMAISKKKEELVKQYRKVFIDNLLANKNISMDFNQAKNLFETIEKFASYGFNKAHAVSYAYLTYTFLFYKANYPKAFYKSCLDSFRSLKDEKFIKLMKEMNFFNLFISNVDIKNSAKNEFNLIDNIFYLPFSRINFNVKINTDFLSNFNQESDNYKQSTYLSKSKFSFQSLADIDNRNDIDSIEKLLFYGKFDLDYFEEDMLKLTYANFFSQFNLSKFDILSNMDLIKLFYQNQTSLDEKISFNSSLDYVSKLSYKDFINLFEKEKEMIGLILDTKQELESKTSQTLISILHIDANYEDKKVFLVRTKPKFYINDYYIFDVENKVLTQSLILSKKLFNKLKENYFDLYSTIFINKVTFNTFLRKYEVIDYKVIKNY